MRGGFEPPLGSPPTGSGAPVLAGVRPSVTVPGLAHVPPSRPRPGDPRAHFTSSSGARGSPGPQRGLLRPGAGGGIGAAVSPSPVSSPAGGGWKVHLTELPAHWGNFQPPPPAPRPKLGFLVPRPPVSAPVTPLPPGDYFPFPTGPGPGALRPPGPPHPPRRAPPGPSRSVQGPVLRPGVSPLQPVADSGCVGGGQGRKTDASRPRPGPSQAMCPATGRPQAEADRRAGEAGPGEERGGGSKVTAPTHRPTPQPSRNRARALGLSATEELMRAGEEAERRPGRAGPSHAPRGGGVSVCVRVSACVRARVRRLEAEGQGDGGARACAPPGSQGPPEEEEGHLLIANDPRERGISSEMKQVDVGGRPGGLNVLPSLSVTGSGFGRGAALGHGPTGLGPGGHHAEHLPALAPAGTEEICVCPSQPHPPTQLGGRLSLARAPLATGVAGGKAGLRVTPGLRGSPPLRGLGRTPHPPGPSALSRRPAGRSRLGPEVAGQAEPAWQGCGPNSRPTFGEPNRPPAANPQKAGSPFLASFLPVADDDTATATTGDSLFLPRARAPRPPSDPGGGGPSTARAAAGPPIRPSGRPSAGPVVRPPRPRAVLSFRTPVRSGPARAPASLPAAGPLNRSHPNGGPQNEEREGGHLKGRPPGVSPVKTIHMEEVGIPCVSHIHPSPSL
ncbi:basic proline-rich protein-like [Tachyglossus aculeatus]|uniref:basic proline-rich protein-like n=1 Tax=Tachyglossus aculeatus TaxID=9261 RepID=UPI0018F7B3A2|nr:basic proline-rich protein-like [Tachyglossus aculeatus]